MGSIPLSDYVYHVREEDVIRYTEDEKVFEGIRCDSHPIEEAEA